MKKTMKITALAVAVITLLFVFASCAPIVGTYATDTGDLAGVEYKFALGKVTIKTTIFGFSKEFEGTYKMGKNDNGDETITFEFEDEDAKSYNTTSIYKSGKDDNGEFISLDGIKLYKKK